MTTSLCVLAAWDSSPPEHKTLNQMWLIILLLWWHKMTNCYVVFTCNTVLRGQTQPKPSLLPLVKALGMRQRWESARGVGWGGLSPCMNDSTSVFLHREGCSCLGCSVPQQREIPEPQGQVRGQCWPEPKDGACQVVAPQSFPVFNAEVLKHLKGS